MMDWASNSSCVTRIDDDVTDRNLIKSPTSSGLLKVHQTQAVPDTNQMRLTAFGFEVIESRLDLSVRLINAIKPEF